MKHYRLFLLLIGLLVLAFLADIAIGSVSLSIRDVWNTFIGSNDNLIYREIIFPKSSSVLACTPTQISAWLKCIKASSILLDILPETVVSLA